MTIIISQNKKKRRLWNEKLAEFPFHPGQFENF